MDVSKGSLLWNYFKTRQSNQCSGPFTGIGYANRPQTDKQDLSKFWECNISTFLTIEAGDTIWIGDINGETLGMANYDGDIYETRLI